MMRSHTLLFLAWLAVPTSLVAQKLAGTGDEKIEVSTTVGIESFRFWQVFPATLSRSPCLIGSSILLPSAQFESAG